MSQFSLKGRTALVTGGGSGMGLGYVNGLAEAGADVAVFDLLEPSSELLAVMSIHSAVKIKHYIVDVSFPDSLKAGFVHVEQEFGKLDICVPNAGINKVADFLDMTWEAHQKLISVNVLGLYYTAQSAARLMIKCGSNSGSIILIGSIAGKSSVKSTNHSAYSGTKGAVLGLLPAIAKELGPHGIRVNSISPGYVRTPMTTPYPLLLEGWKHETMLGRVGEAEDMVGACIFLASDASRYMTAHDLVIDGGKTMF